MGRWLSRVENQAKAPEGIPTKPTKQGSVSSVGTPNGAYPTTHGGSVSSVSMPTGAIPEIKGEPRKASSRSSEVEWIKGRSGRPAPAHEAETIITALVSGAGRDLGLPLVNRLRDVLAPMDRPARSKLAAQIDDAFDGASSIGQARRRAFEILDAYVLTQSHRATLVDQPAWIDWIAERCPLLSEDRAFIAQRLHTLPAKARQRIAWRYVETWKNVAADEPRPHAKDNRGRTAANRTLLALICD